MQHPYISAGVLLFWAFYPQFPFHVLYFVLFVIPRSIVLGILTCLGFERGGVREGVYFVFKASVLTMLLLCQTQSRRGTKHGGMAEPRRAVASLLGRSHTAQ